MNLENSLYLVGIALVLFGLACLTIAQIKKAKATRLAAEVYRPTSTTSPQKWERPAGPTVDPRKAQLSRVASAIHARIESK